MNHAVPQLSSWAFSHCRHLAATAPPPLKVLEESDDEDPDANPDMEIQIPAKKVKLMIGPGGEKIKEIQKKSKCRIQVKGFRFGY